MTESKIPSVHLGPDYYHFMSVLSQKRSVKRYLEIGVNEGKLMNVVHASIAVGVDPNFILNQNVTANKNEVHLIRKTSDRFFADCNFKTEFGGSPELCFLDGYHTFEFLLRDFLNTEQISSPETIICMHDCMPLDDVMAIRWIEDWSHATIGTKHQGAWAGDVWKIIPILKRFRPDLKLVMVSAPPTGVVCVTNLDPDNRTLSKQYLDIVSEYSRVENSLENLEGLYKSFDMTPGESILKEMDNTLFFRT